MTLCWDILAQHCPKLTQLNETKTFVYLEAWSPIKESYGNLNTSKGELWIIYSLFKVCKLIWCFFTESKKKSANKIENCPYIYVSVLCDCIIKNLICFSTFNSSYGTFLTYKIQSWFTYPRHAGETTAVRTANITSCYGNVMFLFRSLGTSEVTIVLSYLRMTQVLSEFLQSMIPFHLW